MSKKTLEQVAEQGLIHKLETFAEFHGGQGFKFCGGEPDKLCDRRVWGVREAKTQLPTLLREAADGLVHFVTAGNGTPIVMINAFSLASLMTAAEDRRGLTLAEAISRLPYPPTELKAPVPRRRAPERGLVRRAQAVEQV